MKHEKIFIKIDDIEIEVDPIYDNIKGNNKVTMSSRIMDTKTGKFVTEETNIQEFFTSYIEEQDTKIESKLKENNWILGEEYQGKWFIKGTDEVIPDNWEVVSLIDQHEPIIGIFQKP